MPCQLQTVRCTRLVWIGLQMACDLFERTVMMKAHGTAPVQGNEFDVHYIETGRAVFLLSILVSIGMKSAWRHLLSLHAVNVTGRPTTHCAFALKLAAFVSGTNGTVAFKCLRTFSIDMKIVFRKTSSSHDVG